MTSAPRSKLLILEPCIADSMQSMHTPRLVHDLTMLVQFGDAKERDEREFEQLLGAAGFRLERVIPTKGLFFIVEAVPGGSR